LGQSEYPAAADDEELTAHVGGKIPLATLLSYSPPVMGLSAPLFLVQFYFLNFATDVLLLAPLGVGILFALGRLWDAVSDPIVGTLSDRTHSRLGRRRPWMFAGIPLLMGSLLMIFSPPDFAPAGLYAWVAVALVFFYSAFTMYSVPHSAWGAELTTDHHERSRIFGASAAAFTFGMMFAFGGMQYVISADVPREAASRLVFAAIFVLPLILLVPPVRLRERAEHQGRGATSSWQAMRDVLQNPHARLLLMAQFIQLAGSGTLGLMAPYLMRYVLKRPDLTGAMPAIFTVSTMLSIPIWLRLSRRLGKKKSWVIGLFGSGLSFGMITFAPEGNIPFLALVLASAGFFTASGMMVGNSILADVIDYDEYLTGERKEGAYAAAWGFAIKSATAVVIILVSVALQLSDFKANAEQTEGTILMLRILNGVFPFVMFTLGAAIFTGFQFNEKEHAEVRAALDRRAAEAGV
jgi:GPH family glycoside/pentoside/hexuronide:cation symporter